jgi:hypothetical protein
MAGLLDFLNSAEAQAGLGLLAAAGPRSDGAGFGQRLQEGLGAADQWKARQAAAKRAEMQDQMQQMQMAQAQRQMAMEQAAMEQAARKRAALPGIFQPSSAGAPALNVDSLLPQELRTGLAPQAAVAPRQGGIDVQKALAADYSVKEIQELDALRNIGLNKVARTMKGMQNGREVDQQLDDYGRPVGQGMEQFRAPIEMALGDKKQLLDPYTRQPVASFAMGQSPDSKASNAVAWANNAATLRGQNMTDARARDMNDITRGEKKKIEELTKGGQIASFDTMLGTLDRLGSHPGLSRSVGIVGAFPTMPGSESANFKAELDTFQSQAFIPMVSQLKGMGALSDAEGKKLTAAVGALNPNMGEKAFRESVGRITAEMAAARERVSGVPTNLPAKAAEPGNVMSTLPTANPSNKGRKIRDTTTGKILVSNGMTWTEAP